ncbi:hypothetical protein A2U01_0055344, partial [Trifolium medium]|nr:hypothetical protein [Trifolium medium]
KYLARCTVLSGADGVVSVSYALRRQAWRGAPDWCWARGANTKSIYVQLIFRSKVG